MKILFLGNERRDAQALATALRGIAKNGTVSWAPSVDRAANWLVENSDVAVLVVDAQTDGGNWSPVLKHVRGSAARPAVVVIGPEGSSPRPGSPESEADEYVVRNASLFRDLPWVVARGAARTRLAQQPQKALSGAGAFETPGALGPPPTSGTALSATTRALPDPQHERRTELEEKLAQASAALKEVEQRRLATEAQYELATARAAARWEMVDEQLRTAAIEVESARQHRAEVAADLDRLSRRESELSSQLADATATRSVLERRVADAEAALEAAAALTARERDAAAEQQRALQAQIAEEADQRRTTEGALAEASKARDDAEVRHAAVMMDVAAQVCEVEAALRQSRHALELSTADVERLTRREAELSASLADVRTNHDNLERRLAATEAAFQDADARATSERLAVSKRAAAREAELDGQLRQERATHVALERAVADAETARHDADQRYEAALATAARELSERQAHFDRELAQIGTARDGLAKQLSGVQGALEQVRAAHRSATGDVERLTKREGALTAQLAGLTSQLADVQGIRQHLELQLVDAENAIKSAIAKEATLDGQLRQEQAARAALEKTVAEADAARTDAQQRHEEALTLAARTLAERQAEFDHELSQTVTDRDRLTRRLSEIEGAHAQAVADHRSATADVARLTQREGELTAQLADVQNLRQRLESQLADAENAIKAATARETELGGHLRDERATRAALEQAVAGGEAALREARQRHDAALAGAAIELAERQAHFDRELSQTIAERDRQTARLSEVEGTLTGQLTTATSQLANVQATRQALESQLSDADRAIKIAATREAELEGQLRQERATHTALEQVIADADTERRDALKRHEAALTKTADELAERQTQFDRQLSETVADRDRVTQRLSDVEHDLTTVQAARHSLELQLANAEGAIKEGTTREAELAGQIRQERAARASLESALTSQLAGVEAARQTLERRLEETVKSRQDADERAARDRSDAADRQAGLEGRFAQEIDARNNLERVLGEARAAALDAERSFHEQADALRASAREQLERANAAADAEIRRLTSGLAEAERQLVEARSESQRTLDRQATEHAAMLAARQGEIQQLQEKLTATLGELDVTKGRREALQAIADKVPALHSEIGAGRAESARLFQQAGLAMFRCRRDGALTQVNRAAMTLVSRRTIDELRGGQFATAVFEDPKGLSLLIERCVTSRTRESIETTWRRKDGGRLFVRLSAYACSPDVIEIHAEDLTRLRVLEERLGQSQRMEAVGRLASEVAITCGNLLNDIHQTIQEWLISSGGSTASRQQGELLLAEVTRAAGLLQQLSACGNEQGRTPALVDLNTVIRDLEPVMKRVAGDEVDVHLADTASSLNVDVGAERIERLFVNLASYGRERMPFGGQLKIELGTTVVDRRFAAKHPNVRLGPHALITVTENRRAEQANGLRQPRDDKRRAGEVKRGLDFGTLQGLVGGCGGHLWMTIQPQGDMVAKIRLPLLNSHDQMAPRTLAARGGRTITRWVSSLSR